MKDDGNFRNGGFIRKVRNDGYVSNVENFRNVRTDIFYVQCSPPLQTVLQRGIIPECSIAILKVKVAFNYFSNSTQLSNEQTQFQMYMPLFKCIEKL